MTSASHDLDQRYKSLNQMMKRLHYEKDALLEILNAAQESFGFLSQDLLTYVAAQLGVPLSQVYGVATFYHLFSFEPLGKHNCVVCTGTACFVKGAANIVDAIGAEFDITTGQTTPDGLFSLTTARCIGSCGLAPVVVLDGDVHGKETPQSTIRRVSDTLPLTESNEGG